MDASSDPRRQWLIQEVCIRHDGDARVVLRVLAVFDVLAVLGISGSPATMLEQTTHYLDMLANPPTYQIGDAYLYERHLRDGSSLRLSTSVIECTFGILRLEQTQIRIWISICPSLLRDVVHSVVDWRVVVAEQLQTLLTACGAPHVLARAFKHVQAADDAENVFTEEHVTIFLD